MKYVWQRLNKANKNHYICEVRDTLNPKDSPIWSGYFDGTQAQALRHFMQQRHVKRHMNKVMDNGEQRYSVTVRANSIQLNWLDA